MPLPRISETEWEIMRIVWKRQPVTSADVIVELQKADPSWRAVTAKTLLNRLVRKGALGFESLGRIYHYSAKVAESECVAAATRSFLDRVFGGSLTGMMAHYVEHRKLSRAQMNELRRILESETGR
ncbi:MAG: BlaI/MecI/CopY family transcriptional regulator [Verrucomicrobia bacterium]|nr:BlaI/MecI/CopY family transcriptional regulator [Verrucomicrobiota bacterium]